MGSDQSPPPGVPLSDPQSLEQHFRSRFSELAVEAKAQLDEAGSAAPKVVEGAFRHAWEERERILTPQDLDAFLHEEVRHGAAREKSRRASLHRYDSHHGTSKSAAHAAASPPTTLDVDQSWHHLSRSLHLVPDDAATTHAQEVAGVLRHDTAAHVADMAKRRSWKVPIAIGVVAALVVAGGIYYVDRLGDESAITGALAAPDARTYVAATAQQMIINLDDGTRVTLTPGSKFIVPKRFSGEKLRAVKLEGAANFNVTPARGVPFEVRAADTKVTVTGTVLTIRTYPRDSSVVVALKEGTATVRVGDSTHAVRTGQALYVRKNEVRQATAGEVDEATSWNDHVLTISNRQLRDALPLLKDWYGDDIKVPDLPLLDRPVTIKASLDSPLEAIQAVEKSANVKFGYEGKTMVFHDATPAPKKK
jgi:ferric-dicitrate binding protein FerR (iron transport regulator)